MKNIYVAIAALTIALIPDIVVAQAQVAPAPKPTDVVTLPKYKPVPTIHKVVPKTFGCHVETTPGKLTEVPCLSAADIAKRPPPTACTGADGDAACGMQSVVTPTQQQFGINEIPIKEGFLEVTLQQYSSSTDTKWGAGAYSLQLNSNFFPSGGTTGWVQFVYQDFGAQGGDRFCVWNIDVKNNKYNPVCAAMSSLPLTARVQFTVGGFVCGKGCTYIPNAPALAGWVHWQTLNANGSVCSSCASGTVWAEAPDTYGLASGWTQISGSILGASGSKINFSGNTVDQNVLGATACPVPEAPGWTCATPQLNGQYATTAGWVTAEANNLFYAPSPNWVAPQVPQSALTCSDGFCWLTAYEIFPK